MTLVDTNVLIDVLSLDQTWQVWSATALWQQSLHGSLLINEIVYAELASRYASQQALEEVIDHLNLEVEWLPRPALYIAGRVFSDYRRAGGVRTSVLADFFIGAHAAAVKIPILTRDARRYRTYFPDVALITPD